MLDFALDHDIDLNWLYWGELRGLLRMAAAALFSMSSTELIFDFKR